MHMFVFVAVIIPPQLGLYMSLAPEMKLTYPLGGPAAQTAFDQGLSGFEARAFRGLGVFTSTPVRAITSDTPLTHVSCCICSPFPQASTSLPGSTNPAFPSCTFCTSYHMHIVHVHAMFDPAHFGQR
jgi:hypothetical protein